MAELIIRLTHKAGRNRITMKEDETYGALVQKVSELTSVAPKMIDLYLDQTFKDKIKATEKDILK